MEDEQMIRLDLTTRPLLAGINPILLALIAVAWMVPGAEAQLRASYSEGADVSPGFEGWLPQEDGSYEIVFGYMNRNWEEELHVPVGPDNYFSFVTPGALDDMSVSGYDAEVADQGQPSYFLPRRNRFTFNVPISAEMADQISRGELEVVWTLTTHGSTDRAYGSLVRDYMIDNIVIMSETGALGAGSSDERMRSNEPPEIEVEGDLERTVAVGEPLTLVARVTDDGIPSRGGSPPAEDATPQDLLERAMNQPRRVTVGKINGLFHSWFVYRGPGEKVAFDPPQVKTWEDTRAFANSPWGFFWVPPEPPEDDRWVTQVTFDEPGTYVLRGRADDGGLFADVEVTVHVIDRPAL
jgi:hypothetical protein